MSRRKQAKPIRHLEDGTPTLNGKHPNHKLCPLLSTLIRNYAQCKKGSGNLRLLIQKFRPISDSFGADLNDLNDLRLRTIYNTSFFEALNY